jgi:hypothetical protein
MVGVNDAPRSQKLIRPTGALESLDAERRRFNDRLLLLLRLRLRRPLFERTRRRRSGEPASPTADSPLRSQFEDPVLPRPASSGIRARVPSRTSHPVFRARAAAKTTPDDENMFETQELIIGGVDRARKAPETAKNDHAWNDFVDLANKCLCFGRYLLFIGPQVFKTKLDNDSDIDQSGCTALPATCRRHVVNG